jgi:hypothetical protein
VKIFVTTRSNILPALKDANPGSHHLSESEHIVWRSINSVVMRMHDAGLSSRYLANLVATIELTALEHTSSSVIPRHLLGLERSPDFGSILRTTCFQLSGFQSGSSPKVVMMFSRIPSPSPSRTL